MPWSSSFWIPFDYRCNLCICIISYEILTYFFLSPIVIHIDFFSFIQWLFTCSLYTRSVREVFNNTLLCQHQTSNAHIFLLSAFSIVHDCSIQCSLLMFFWCFSFSVYRIAANSYFIYLILNTFLAWAILRNVLSVSNWCLWSLSWYCWFFCNSPV